MSDYGTPRQVTFPIYGSVEDLMLGILRPFFEGTGVNILSYLEEDMPLPAVIARQDRKSGAVSHFTDDPRFLMPALLAVDTIAGGMNADQDSADLQEAVRHAIFDAHYRQIVIPGVGYISHISHTTKASRVSDWATSTGVVQYASLPKGAVRYESNYRLILRPDQNQANTTNPFIRPQSPQ